MNFKKKLFSVALALTLCVSLTGCGQNASEGSPTPTPTPTQSASGTETNTETESSQTAQNPGGTLVMSFGTEPTNLNPNGNYDANNNYIMQNCFSRLIKMNSRQQVIPDLAESYTISDDGLSYTFNLRKDIYFHDGVKLTSADVKFTFEEMRAQETFASHILGKVASIECPDDDTVVFNMSAVDASFLHNLSYQGTFILPKHVYEGKEWGGADAMQTPVGTGPFVFGSWDKGVRISLTRNDNYFLGPDLPYLDGVIFAFVSDATTAKTAFLAGEYDILGVFSSTDYNEMRNHGNIEMEVNIYPSRFIVEFNMAQEPFDDINLRMAIAHAINNEEMLEMALKEVGLEAEHYLSPLFDWAIDKNVRVPEYDLTKALEYMELTGLTKDSNGNYLSVTIDTMNYSPFPDLAQVFKSQMAEIGIDVTINMLEYASFDEKVVKNKDFSIGITSDYQGPEVSAIGNSISSEGYLNCTGFYSPDVDRLLQEALNLASFEERAPLYKEVQRILAEEMPYYVVSEWIGYYPHWDYVKGHPASEGTLEKAGSGEFTYIQLDN